MLCEFADLYKEYRAIKKTRESLAAESDQSPHVDIVNGPSQGSNQTKEKETVKLFFLVISLVTSLLL